MGCDGKGHALVVISTIPGSCVSVKHNHDENMRVCMHVFLRILSSPTTLSAGYSGKEDELTRIGSRRATLGATQELMDYGLLRINGILDFD